MSQKLVSQDYIFRKKNKALQFVGDFEGFYKDVNDPWGQKGTDRRLKAYYAYSRSHLVQTLRRLLCSSRKTNILEVGCGLGYVAVYLQKSLGMKFKVTGIDISPTAVQKAQSRFPDLSFKVADITSSSFKESGRYDVVIMSQILWYVLENFPQVFTNVRSLLKPNGYLVFVNAFIRDQKYGRDIVDGFDGLVGYVLTHYPHQYKIIQAEFDDSKKFLHDDGLLVMRKV